MAKPECRSQAAKQCIFDAFNGLPGPTPSSAIDAFAAVVRAEEREKVARWMISKSLATGHGDTIEDLLNEAEPQIRSAERSEHGTEGR